MKIFRVYFKDGNQKLFSACDMMMICEYIVCHTEYSLSDIYKIEEME